MGSGNWGSTMTFKEMTTENLCINKIYIDLKTFLGAIRRKDYKNAKNIITRISETVSTLTKENRGGKNV